MEKMVAFLLNSSNSKTSSNLLQLLSHHNNNSPNSDGFGEAIMSSLHHQNKHQIMQSTKMLLNAAKLMTKLEGGDVESPADVAGAMSTILATASTWGPLEEQKYGKYVHMAVQYLRSLEGQKA